MKNKEALISTLKIGSFTSQFPFFQNHQHFNNLKYNDQQ